MNMKNKDKPIKAADIDIALQMLNRHMDAQEIETLLSTLQALKNEPGNESRREAVVEAFHNLGIKQGAVLTYAPYLNVFISDDPFGD